VAWHGERRLCVLQPLRELTGLGMLSWERGNPSKWLVLHKKTGARDEKKSRHEKSANKFRKPRTSAVFCANGVQDM